MSIVKKTPTSLFLEKIPYTAFGNDTLMLIKDSPALSIYVYLYMQYTGWDVCERNIMNHFGKGRDFVRKGLKYLRELGLIKKYPIKNEKGQIAKWDMRVYASPQTDTEKTPQPIDKHKETTIEDLVATDQVTEKPPCGEKTPKTRGRKTRRVEINPHINNINNKLLLKKKNKQKKEKPKPTNKQFEQLLSQQAKPWQPKNSPTNENQYHEADGGGGQRWFMGGQWCS